VAGGALLVRVAVMIVSGEGARFEWLSSAAACVLAGVALVLIALPKIVPSGEPEGTDQPTPELPRG
jgi:predicted cobalt transporter CbtA